jgi:hypothetical protein
MVQQTDECVFLYVLYVKCGSARKSQRKYCSELPGVTIPSTTGINKLNKRYVYWASFRQETHYMCCIASDGRVDETGTKPEYSQQSLKSLAKATGISKSTAAQVMKLLQPLPCKITF